MKNIRKFKMAADKEAAVIEEYSVSYVTENDKVYTTPENGGQSNGDIKNYMRFVAVEDSQINLTTFNFVTGEADTSVDLKHSKDGVTWTQYDFNPIPLAAGETLYLKGNNENGFSHEARVCTFGNLSNMGIPNTPSTGKFECHGNIMSLLYGDDFEYKTTIPSMSCFGILFGSCTSLTTAPELPAMTLADRCYYFMFWGCTSLTTAPELPATTLASNCYQGMFNGCTSLTTAPELPAMTLADRCYYYMFQGCTNLSKITMLATDITAEECLTMWTGMIDNETHEEVSGVAPTGVFVKNAEMKNLPIGNQENRFSGIPEGWVVEDYKQINELTSLTITADDVSANQTRTKIYYTAIGNYRDENGVLVEENITVTGQAFSDTFPMNDSYTEDVIREISFTYMGVTATTTITQHAKVPYHKQYLTLKVSKDAYVRFTSAVGPASLMDEISTPYEYSYDGISWMPYDDSEIHLTSGQQISWKGYYEKWTGNRGFVVYEKDEYGYQSNGVDFIAYGNVMSLLYGDEFYGKTEIPEGCGLGDLFSGSRLIDASNLILPATTLTKYCYSGMFAGCTNLTTAPELPATTLALSCYQNMFWGCTGLTTVPDLPATTLTQQCYQYMFNGCTSLTTAPELPATTLTQSCYSNMFNGCTSLTTAPELPVTTLANSCYYGMFEGCTSLTTAPELPATTLAEWCYLNMFNGCTSLTTAPELPATTLSNYCYQAMFFGCTNLTTAPELPATTLVQDCYCDMFAGCTSLNHITMLATDISAEECLENWVDGVSPTGTFVKHPDIDSLPTGENGIPEGWTVEDAVI